MITYDIINNKNNAETIFFLQVELCEKLGISSTKSSTLLIFIGLSTIVSRVTSGVLQNSPRVSILFVFQSCQFLNAMTQLAIPFAYKFEHFIIICILYGLADGGFATSLNNILLNSVRPEQLSSAFGFGCFVSSLSIAAGAPLAGIVKNIQLFVSFLSSFSASFLDSFLPRSSLLPSFLASFFPSFILWSFFQVLDHSFLSSCFPSFLPPSLSFSHNTQLQCTFASIKVCW